MTSSDREPGTRQHDPVLAGHHNDLAVTERSGPGKAVGSERTSSRDGGVAEGGAQAWFDSLTSVAASVREGRLSPVDLVSGQLERARSIGKALNCFVSVMDDDALKDAERLEELANAGTIVGPLHGVPVTIKDNIAAKGVRTTAASAVSPVGAATEDAVAVRRLKQAGAVVMAKTNLSEYAFGSTSPVFGEVVNPWDPSRSTGGSSSGSAAALAAGIGYGSVGTDTGGSIRIPSSMCGLVGLKPTFGLIELDGVTTISRELDHVGPMGRYVRDVGQLLSVMARSGWEGRDRSAQLQEPVRGLRVGVLEDTELAGSHPDALSALGTVREVLSTGGCSERVARIPDRAVARSTMWTIAAVDLLVDLEPQRENPGMGESLKEALRRAAGTSALNYATAQRARAELTRELDAVFEEIDVLLTPGVPIPAHPTSERSALRDVRQAYTPLFDLTGNPALIVPATLSREGLPLGVQLVGRRLEDHVLLELGQLIETAMGSPWSQVEVRERIEASDVSLRSTR